MSFSALLCCSLYIHTREKRAALPKTRSRLLPRHLSSSLFLSLYIYVHIPLNVVLATNERTNEPGDVIGSRRGGPYVGPGLRAGRARHHRVLRQGGGTTDGNVLGHVAQVHPRSRRRVSHQTGQGTRGGASAIISPDHLIRSNRFWEERFPSPSRGNMLSMSLVTSNTMFPSMQYSSRLLLCWRVAGCL